MLKEIRIQGLGVIDDATIPLGAGLNVLTGETGAGKTMVVSALGLLLGERADSGRVRTGSDRASVEGLVDVPPDHPAAVRAKEAGGDVQDGLILARTVAGTGRSRAFVGGRSAPVSVLADLGEHLVAVHGQADQWRLQRPDQHRVVLDAFGGDAIRKPQERYQELLHDWRQSRRELADLMAQRRERAQRLAMLTKALEEIEQVNPQPGEDDSLREEADRLTHVDALQDAAHTAQLALLGDDHDATHTAATVTELVAQARSALNAAAGLDPTLAGLDKRLQEVGVLAGELGADLASYLADLDSDPARLAQIHERRATLTALQRSYGDTLEDVLEWSRNAAVEAGELAGTSDRVEELERAVAELEPAVGEAASALSEARKVAAADLAEQVSDELDHLAMASAQLSVQVSQREEQDGLPLPDGRRVLAHPHGVDDLEILLAAGSGTPPRSVAKAASGGELSRVMLALEVVTGSGDVPTFVFDEVDAGIGGAAALDVGARLQALAQHAQVIVVTHLAQVAAYADRHLVVRKEDDGHVTSSGVVLVEGRERESELARMLGGKSDSSTARKHARELLAAAAQVDQ
ncbi:DNA repair protein RecN [Demetria terragena]|uniref:DNA repair protein RecN n=1 Tax=Demetria terragena TaxID=63959 RepID=UPI000361A2B3|nr:DNA repair protein RecN [Demetria terragena]